MQNFSILPDDVWNIIVEMKEGMERHDRLMSCVVELYFHGFLGRRPRFISSIWWSLNL